MGGVSDVTIVEPWVFDDLSAGSFSQEEQRRVLYDVETLEEQLTIWDRSLTKCVEMLSNTGGVTVYRRRVGDLRVYYLRHDETLYCIGVGKRKTTYDRDLDRMISRAREYQSSDCSNE